MEKCIQVYSEQYGGTNSAAMHMVMCAHSQSKCKQLKCTSKRALRTCISLGEAVPNVGFRFCHVFVCDSDSETFSHFITKLVLASVYIIFNFCSTPFNSEIHFMARSKKLCASFALNFDFNP